MNILNNLLGGSANTTGGRKFVKKWHGFKGEFVYKELSPANGKLNIISRKEFFMLRLVEEVEVINDDELPPKDDDDDGYTGRKGMI